jgi:amino acid transporter
VFPSKVDAAGKPVPFQIAYPEKDEKGQLPARTSAGSVTGMHNFGWMFVQATIAILILVGFESVTSMGAGKDPKRHIPIAVVTSLLVTGSLLLPLRYFAANYFPQPGYTIQSAVGSAAPIGDMMVIGGQRHLGPAMGASSWSSGLHRIPGDHRHHFILHEHRGTRDLRDGQDEEMPEFMGALHAQNLTPHRGIWTLAVISAVVGCVTVCNLFGDAGALSDATVKALPQGFWSRSFGYFSHDTMAALPNSLLLVTLASNFGTFVLYALSCVTCLVAFRNHPKYNPLRHLVIPIFGLRGEPGVHGVLPDRAVHGIWHQTGTAAGSRGRPGVGSLRRNLFHSLQQNQGAHYLGRRAWYFRGCRIVTW